MYFWILMCFIHTSSAQYQQGYYYQPQTNYYYNGYYQAPQVTGYNTFQKQYPLPGFLAGTKTPVFLATSNFAIPGQISFSQYPGVMDQVFSFDNSNSYSTDSNNYNKQVQQNGDIVYPEILVFVDNIIFSRFNYNVEKTVEYVLMFWNAVDLKLVSLSNPRVSLNVAGIVIAQNELPFITRSTVLQDTNKIYYSHCMNEFGQSLFNQQTFNFQEHYDIAVLMTVKDIVSDYLDSGISGSAFTGGACQQNVNSKIIYSVAIIEDNAGYSGVISAAHEIGHLLGASHDGEVAAENTKLPGGIECSAATGNLMSVYRYNMNQFTFSACSQRAITYNLSLEKTKCLRNNPAVKRNDKAIKRILPGKHMPLSIQCRQRGYWTAVSANPNVCIDLQCYGFDNNVWDTKTPAVDGSDCGFGMHCLNGQCIAG